MLGSKQNVWAIGDVPVSVTDTGSFRVEIFYNDNSIRGKRIHSLRLLPEIVFIYEFTCKYL